MIHQALSPSEVNWLSPLILGGQFTGGVHPPNQFVPETVTPLPCSAALVRHTLLIFFFKELIFFIGSLDKCHTSVLFFFSVRMNKTAENAGGYIYIYFFFFFIFPVLSFAFSVRMNKTGDYVVKGIKL